MKIQASLFLTVLSISSCRQQQKIDLPATETSTLVFLKDAEKMLPGWSEENTIITHVISEPDNLHPTNGNSSPRSEIFPYIHRTLMYIDYSSQNVVPGLVESMPVISDDKLSYSYKLRDDISWDDGNLLTIDDILFTAKAFKCALTNNPSVKIYWENVQDIIPQKDGASFTFIMKKNNVQNKSFLGSFPVIQRVFHDPDNILSSFSLHQFNDTGFNATAFPELQTWAKEFNSDAYGRDPAKLNGLGMYKVSEWEAGQYITLIKKTDHWTKGSDDYHEVAYPEKLIFKLNKDEASQMLQFRSQQLDVSINISTGTFINLSSDESIRKNFNCALMPTFNYSYICFNERPDGIKHKKLFDDVKVRKAIAMITPVDKLMNLIYKDYSKQCKKYSSNVSPLKEEFNSELKPVEYNMNAAMALLNESGWIDSDNDGLLDKLIDGKRTSLHADLMYLSTSNEWKNMAILFMEELAKAGIKINPVPVDLKLFLEKGRAHDFDLLMGSWSAPGFPEDYTQLWHTSSWVNHGTNYSGFGNAETDAIIDSIKTDLGDSIRFELSRKLQKKIYEDQPYIFLFSGMRRNILHKRFANQMLFSERPGIMENMLLLLSIKNGITMTAGVQP
jgi:peptide/nickel transport system substrate-binding protein